MFSLIISKSFPLILIYIPALSLGHALYLRQHGDLCDWRSPGETCDETRGLACSYKSQRCTCWDIRTVYSPTKGRCVGKAGEECHMFGGERLCTENAYCLEDETLSSIPICVCVKGHYRGENGNCMRKSKFGEFCDPTATKYSPSSSRCETESGLQCINYKCQCEPNQIYDPDRELCISLVGMPCSKSLNNCVENSECNEKIYALDHMSGTTKMIGHRCSCKNGLKVTEDGYCAVNVGGKCKSTSECLAKEGLTCLNGICQCHPLSQVYDWRVRRCLNLVGTRCHFPQHKKQDRISMFQDDEQEGVVEDPIHDQQEVGWNLEIDSFGREHVSPSPSPSPSSSSVPTQTPSSSTSTTKATSSFASSSSSSASPSTSKLTPSPSSTSTTTAAATTSGTTPSPISIISSRNLSSRTFKYPSYRSRSNISRVHIVRPRHFKNNPSFYRREPDFENLVPEHREAGGNEVPPAALMECVPGAECLPSSPTSSDFYCVCKSGATETIMRTCLLDHGSPCGAEKDLGKMETLSSSSSLSASQPSIPLECNVFEGLVCENDKRSCECADPMLKYDNNTRSCLSSIGNPCGRMRVNSNLINSFNYNYGGDKGRRDEGEEDLFSSSSSIPPFYVQQSDVYIYVNCEAGATCVDRSVNGQLKQVCLPKGKFPTNKFGVGFAS